MWPPPYAIGELGRDARPARPFPPPGWPSRAQVDYTQAIVLLGLLLLALPWLVSRLLSDPGSVLTGLGRRAVHKTPL